MNSNTPPPNIGRVTVNLVLIVLALATISGWLLYYTDWFPVVGGLFTLSGFFAWLAFVSNLLTKARAGQLQDAFDEKVLQSKGAPIVLVAAMVVLALIFAAGRGTLVLDGLQDTKARTVELKTLQDGKLVEGAPLQRLVVPARERVKVSMWTGFLGAREIYVEAAGLPWKRVVLQAFERTQIQVPSSFMERAVLLVRPHAKDLATLARSPDRFRLVIEIGGGPPYLLDPYGGEAVLIGAQAGIELPESLVDAWRLEFLEAEIPASTALRWMQPRIKAPFVELPADGEVTARIELKSDPETSQPTRATISPTGMASTYPLEMVVSK